MKRIPLPGRSPDRPTLWQLIHRKRRWYWGLGLALLLTGLLVTRVVPDRVPLQAGETAGQDIRAHRNVTYISDIATERLRDEAEKRVPRRYDDVPNAPAEAVRFVNAIYTTFTEARSAGASPDVRTAAARKRLPATVRLSDTTLQTGVTASQNTLEDLRRATEQVVAQVMDADIRSDNEDLQQARVRAGQAARNLGLPPGATAMISEVAKSAIRPTRVLSVERTTEARMAARRSVAPVVRSIGRDEIIVHGGDRITEEHVERFEALGLQQRGLDFGRLVGLFLYMGILLLAVSFFLRYYQPAVYHDTRKIGLLMVLIIISAAGLKIGYSFLGVELSNSQLGYMTTMWIALPAMLASTLVNPSVAVLLAAILSLMAGVAWDVEPRFLALSLVGALAGIFGVSRIRDRSDLMRIAAILAVTNTAQVWILGLLGGETRAEMLMGTWWVMGTGLGSALLFWLGVAALERPFGIVTHVGLLELCDLNRELLRRMQWEAPGTFHHSLGVAVLAEAAAEAIGADALLARVSAYYHDIGKLRRPQHFVENQQGENIHDRIAPTLSTIAITSHVKEGMELARQYHLPPQVAAGITQHHGTSLVSYFYQQATGGEPQNGDALEQQFRYDGPRPQTKEMAILMLADSVEAISRTIDKPTPQKLEQAVSGMIEARLKDGQLDECDLTFRDLGRIKSAFVRVLVSMLHARIDYPNATVSETNRPHGDLDPKDAPGPDAAPEATDAGRSSAAV